MAPAMSSGESVQFANGADKMRFSHGVLNSVFKKYHLGISFDGLRTIVRMGVKKMKKLRSARNQFGRRTYGLDPSQH